MVIGPITGPYMAMQKRMFALWSSFGSRGLMIIADFITHSTELAVPVARISVARQHHAPAAPTVKNAGAAVSSPAGLKGEGNHDGSVERGAGSISRRVAQPRHV